MSRGRASVSLRELARSSLEVGCLGFGGPAGQIALMHRIFVEERKWIDEARYLHALNYCMLLPGPEAQQLAVYVGWLLRGVRGGIIAGTLFVVPGALLVFALAWLYAAHADLPAVAALFYGVKAAVVGIVAEAVFRIGRRAMRGTADLLVAVASLLALSLFGVPFPLVVVAAAAVGALLAPPVPGGARAPSPSSPSRPAVTTVRVASAWALAWVAPLALAWSVLGSQHVLVRVGLLFSRLALVTFGGAYALLAYLRQQAVEVQGWLTAAQMIDGLGLAETTPGPLVLVNQFVGFLAGWNAGGGLGMAAAAAAMASWCTFAPSFLWIFAGAPFAERLRESRHATAALRAITAAVLGVVASLGVWFALHVAFARTHFLDTAWGHPIEVPVAASLDPFAALLALGAATALIRFKAPLLLVIALCALAGLLRLLGAAG